MADTTNDLWRLDAVDTAALIRTGQASAREVVESALARLHEVNPTINAVVLTLEESALAEADQADRALRAGEPVGPLHGVPVTTKVNTDQAGLPNDGGVVAQKDKIAAEDSPVIGSMRDAGAIVIGRTNTPTFSMRWFTENDLHGRTLNPWDKDTTPGGSSGGAGAATVTGIGTIGQGNDIAGSIRYPAYANGIVGLRPTIGRIAAGNPSGGGAGRALGGVSMAVNGPLTRTVRDARLALQVMATRDVRDTHWVDVPLQGPPPPRPIRVALAPTLEDTPVDPAISEAVRTAGRYLQSAGYEVEEVEPPDFAATAELWHHLGVTDVLDALSVRMEELGDDAGRRSLGFWRASRPGTDLQGYLAAHVQRDALLTRWSTFFQDYPLIVMPSSGERPFPQNLDLVDQASKERALIANRPQLSPAVLGMPGIAVPLGSDGGIPLGVQILADRFREDLLLDAAEVIEAHEGVRTPIDPTF